MIPHSPIARLLAAVATMLLHAEIAFAQKPTANADLAGAPIVAARQAAIAGQPFQRTLDADVIRRWMEIGSSCTIAEFELFLSPLSPSEQRLVERVEALAPPIVNRMHFQDLRAVLKSGRLDSVVEEEQRGDLPKHTTPALENALYGAYDCVFASIGPPDGSPRYGDVILRLRDSVRERGWATPFSGMHFVYAIRHKDARKMQQMLAAGQTLSTQPTNPLSLGFDDRLHFSHYVVVEKDWNKALAYQAILVIRNAGDSPAGQRVRERFSLLLKEDDPDTFWKLFIPARETGLPPEESAARVPFGYLEGKFDNQLSLDDVTSMEVPAEKLNEVLAWPEVREHARLIRAIARDGQ